MYQARLGTTLIMKKFLSFALVAMMVVLAAISVSAVEWVAGNGYDVYTGASYGEATAVEKSPVTLTENEDGSVTVEQGGYYHGYTFDGNWGGAATAEKVGLDGLVVEITFDEVPTPTNDCWFGVLLLQKPEVFSTGDMASNGGWNPLIRFNVPNLEYHGDMFSNDTGSSETIGTLFGLQSGDVLKMSVEYKLGQYYVTYDHNGQIFEAPAEKSLSASNRLIADGGMAHVVLTGTLLGDLCNWKYTVNVTPGEGISEEELANREFEQSKGSAAAEVAGYVADVAKALAEANELAADNASDDIAAAIAAIEAAAEAADAAVLAIEEAADQAAIDAAIQAGKDAKAAANAGLDEVNLYIEMGAEEVVVEEAPVEEVEEEAAEEEVAEVEVEEEAEGSNMTLIIIIVVVVVVIAILAVVLGKKKKN